MEQVRERIVILADGDFPESDIPLGYLENADKIICCDGAVENLVDYGIEPDYIVGDMDSIPEALKVRFSSNLHIDRDEDCNDLTKAVRFSIERGYTDLVILGASGKREDHTLGNISLLSDYSESLAVRMITDHGIFLPVKSGDKVSSYPGQQVSVFSFGEGQRAEGGGYGITTENLKYPLEGLELKKLWMGTLNECTDDYFSLIFMDDSVIVFLAF